MTLYAKQAVDPVDHRSQSLHIVTEFYLSLDSSESRSANNADFFNFRCTACAGFEIKGSARCRRSASDRNPESTLGEVFECLREVDLTEKR